jgi:hypothetical protein
MCNQKSISLHQKIVVRFPTLTSLIQLFITIPTPHYVKEVFLVYVG